jgi:hypothetical protein
LPAELCDRRLALVRLAEIARALPGDQVPDEPHRLFRLVERTRRGESETTRDHRPGDRHDQRFHRAPHREKTARIELPVFLGQRRFDRRQLRRIAELEQSDPHPGRQPVVGRTFGQGLGERLPGAIAAELDQVAHDAGANVRSLGVEDAAFPDHLDRPAQRRLVSRLEQRLRGAHLLRRIAIVELAAQLAQRRRIVEADGQSAKRGLLGLRVGARLRQPAQRLETARLARPAKTAGNAVAVRVVALSRGVAQQPIDGAAVRLRARTTGSGERPEAFERDVPEPDRARVGLRVARLLCRQAAEHGVGVGERDGLGVVEHPEEELFGTLRPERDDAVEAGVRRPVLLQDLETVDVEARRRLHLTGPFERLRSRDTADPGPTKACFISRSIWPGAGAGTDGAMPAMPARSAPGLINVFAAAMPSRIDADESMPPMPCMASAIRSVCPRRAPRNWSNACARSASFSRGAPSSSR